MSEVYLKIDASEVIGVTSDRNKALDWLIDLAHARGFHATVHRASPDDPVVAHAVAAGLRVEAWKVEA